MRTRHLLSPMGQALGFRRRCVDGDVSIECQEFAGVDARDLVAIDRIVFEGGYRGQHDILLPRRGWVATAATSRCVVGHALLLPVFDLEGEWSLDTVAVLPERQGAGIGTRLAQAAIGVAESLDAVEVTAAALHGTDGPARERFLTRQGFSPTGTGRSYRRVLREVHTPAHEQHTTDD